LDVVLADIKKSLQEKFTTQPSELKQLNFY